MCWNNISCNCLPDYIGSGDKCEGEYDSDMYTCNDKGTCNEGPGFSYTCDCQDGFSGDQCEMDIDVCNVGPAKCVHGSCDEGIGLNYTHITGM